MTDTNQLPPHTITIHDHPEPHIMQWSDLELAAVKRYAEQYALQARAQVQGEPQQPATPEPVGFTYQAEIDYANSTGGNGSFWRVPPDLDDEAVPLYTHPAPSDDVVRDAERYRLIRDGSGWPAVFAAHDAPEPLRGDDLDAAMLATKDTK